ncbi:MAG: hypothetical protein AB1714_22185 [Acidobacteriota bacterium]
MRLCSRIHAGTTYVQHAGGGGGYGPPTERPIEKVQQEVRGGILSLESARDLYAIALDPHTCEVLSEETARLRGGRK